MGYFIADLHERLALSTKLAERHFGMTFEQAAVGLALVDLDGSFIKVNRKLCELLGYDEDELYLRRFQDITLPEDLAESLAGREQVLMGDGRALTFEKRYLRKDGSRLWIELTLAASKTPEGVADRIIA
ncbi:MAG: hypothetical protein JWL62_2900, partial [Hyphomicrobiales bacterium]|nr:hypothetical protein [Hyphomicrobiales bacterium]